MDLIRDTTVGQLLRALTRNRILKYPEELQGFQCPLSYEPTAGDGPTPGESTANEYDKPSSASQAAKPHDPEKGAGETNEDATAVPTPEPETRERRDEEKDEDEVPPLPGRRQSTARVTIGAALQKISTRSELEQRFAEACRMENCSDDDSITPDKLECGTTVVDWYSTQDPANPQNWSLRRKMFVSAIL